MSASTLMNTYPPAEVTFVSGSGSWLVDDAGDNDALDWYRRSLAINEALGNRSGMANSLSEMGVLFTKTGIHAEGVSFNLRSLALRLELQLPQVRIDLNWPGAVFMQWAYRW